jgi:hypothetical protein
MARGFSSTKRVLITKANKQMVIYTAIAAFVVIFCLVAAKALASQAAYQNRVINKKKQALTQLHSDLNARDSLVNSYQAFVDTNQNVLGGNPDGTGDQDGDNARLVLDALPSKYDFPALATTLEKAVTSQNLQILGITGTDEEVTQQANQTSTNPQPIPMQFQVQVSGKYDAIQKLVGFFEHSIRPFQVQTVEYSGDEGNMSATITARTFYQPEKSLNITTEVVR